MGVNTANDAMRRNDVPGTTAQLVVVVPTYNEAGNIRALVRHVERPRTDEPFDVLVVDDNSPDGTAAIVAEMARVRPWLHLLRRDRPTGLGSAYRAGFRWALARDYEFIGEMDGDLSHDPSAIPGLYRAAAGGADLVVGSRYVPGGATIGWPLRRKVLSWGANTFARQVLGLAQRDVTAGFRIYRRDAAELISTRAECEGYGFQVEGTYLVTRSAMTIRELPITFRERTVGGSKMSKATAVEAARRCLSLALWAQPHAPEIAAVSSTGRVAPRRA